MTEHLGETETLQVRKLTYWVPAATAPCEACGHTVVYNLAADVLQHEDEQQDAVCPQPWPAVG